LPPIPAARCRSCRPFLLSIRPPPQATLFPYTSLFRSPCFTTHKFRNIRVFLLRHNRRTGTEAIWKIDKIKCRRCPKHELFRETRSEEHTSELQSRFDLVCRLLLEKKRRTRRTMCLARQ